jgi:hypothetical protein
MISAKTQPIKSFDQEQFEHPNLNPRFLSQILMDFTSTTCIALYKRRSIRTTSQFQQWRKSISNLMSLQILNLVVLKLQWHKQVLYDDVEGERR